MNLPVRPGIGCQHLVNHGGFTVVNVGDVLNISDVVLTHKSLSLEGMCLDLLLQVQFTALELECSTCLERPEISMNLAFHYRSGSAPAGAGSDHLAGRLGLFHEPKEYAEKLL